MSIAEPLAFGIQAETGMPVPLPSWDEWTQSLARRIETGELQRLYTLDQELQRLIDDDYRALMSHLDPRCLTDTGWGILIDDRNEQAEAILDQLKPLTMLRSQQMKRIFKPMFCTHGASAEALLNRFQAGSGQVNPKRGLPYYLLLIGGPDRFSLQFQYDLSVQFAVGRLCFDHLEDYGTYARRVANAEGIAGTGGKRACIFAPRHPNDRPTRMAQDFFIQPLVQSMRTRKDWTLDHPEGSEATKSRLNEICLTGKFDLLGVIGHGLRLKPDPKRLATYQGSLVCANWSGSPGPMTVSDFFSAGDLKPNMDLAGQIVFMFSCYGAGWNAVSDYYFMRNHDPEEAQSPLLNGPTAGISPLPKAMLAHPQGAFAVIAHVDRALVNAFHSPNALSDISDFESCMLSLMMGKPVGLALEALHLRYLTLGTRLSKAILSIRSGRREKAADLAQLWAAFTDARNFILLGDPAVYLA